MLHDNNLLYAPDYVINSAGIVKVVNDNENEISIKINYIYELLIKLFKQSKLFNISPAIIADKIANQILYPKIYSKEI